MASSTDWKALHNPDINIYAKRLIDKILELSKDCIPNKIVTIQPSDSPWMTSSIKRYIRKRKRAYHRAKQTNFMNDWNTFRRLRNKTMIRESKKHLMSLYLINLNLILYHLNSGGHFSGPLSPPLLKPQSSIREGQSSICRSGRES